MTEPAENSETDRLFRNAVAPLRTSSVIVVLALFGFGLWAALAPLATTIRAHGVLVSSQPSFDIQHPYGGSIETVHVTLHDRLTKGMPIVTLDMNLQVKSLIQIEGQIAQIRAENQVITDMLAGKDPPTPPAEAQMIYNRYLEKRRELQVNLASSVASGLTLADQIASSEAALDQMRETHHLMRAQEDRLARFRDRGLSTTSEADETRMRGLTMASEIAEKEASLAALKDKEQKSILQQDLLDSRFRLDLLERFTSNEARLPDLERRAIRLQDEIEKSVIRAPINGTVAALNFNTENMYLQRGSNIATLARALENPTIRFTIPVSTIEQTYVGMTGVVTLSSLPQRNLSKVTARVTSISPQALKDEGGVALGYEATAEFQPGELEAALASLDHPVSLSSDMPVSLALEGRQTTFGEYLIAPFFKIYEGALQD